MTQRNITGHKIKELRILNKMTQQQLATKLNLLGLNIDRPMISKIENKTREVDDIELKKLSKVFKVDVNELFK